MGEMSTNGICEGQNSMSYFKALEERQKLAFLNGYYILRIPTLKAKFFNKAPNTYSCKKTLKLYKSKGRSPGAMAQTLS
jgi:hypothetical protein